MMNAELDLNFSKFLYKKIGNFSYIREWIDVKVLEQLEVKSSEIIILVQALHYQIHIWFRCHNTVMRPVFFYNIILDIVRF